ncbi:membrane protein insertase YidC [Malonomonas rubra]|uniref:membrane protein insertase YidC n=1 Tax=Malonomonas rubra TaxID=57040 RepID=UPI0026F14832|nr:membrane protein insertase YidC [Malonomonas rubra]
MDNNKNVIIAILLMVSVWMFFNPGKQPEAPVADETAVTSAVSSETEQPAAPASLAVAEPVLSAKPAPETKVLLDTPLYTVEFNSLGAKITTLQLHHYTETASADSPQVKVVDAATPRLATLSLQGKNGITLAADTAYALLSPPDKTSLSGADQVELTFRTSVNGLIVDRIFTLRGDSYVIGVQTLLRNTGTAEVNGELELSLQQQWDDKAKSDMVVFNGASSLVDGSLEQVKVDDLKEKSPSYGSGTVWTSFETKYFMSALIPEAGASEKVRVLREGNTIFNVMTTPFFKLAPGASSSFSYQSYFGPRDEKVLESVGYQLSEAISFGWFTPIAVPLLKTLKFFYGYIGNYGVAIILLTLIIKLIFWPLTHKSYASMKSMQKLQPEMTKIKERFKNDRQRQGQEMMELYKKHRVNPMGGCLPMVIQIPVFFALYRVLYQAIELRHAPFVFWLTDLSAPDPYYITPLIMGATMFIQQKLTPSTADPTQQKVMLIMPVVFTAMFLNFPAGLVIYWLVNNLLTIVQQLYIHRTMS